MHSLELDRHRQGKANKRLELINHRETRKVNFKNAIDPSLGFLSFKLRYFIRTEKKQKL